MTAKPLHLVKPRLVILPDGDTLRLCFQDDERQDLVVVEFDRDFAATLRDEFASAAPATAAAQCALVLDEGVIR